MDDIQVDLAAERRRVQEKRAHVLFTARARSLLAEQWNATEKQLRAEIERRYPKISAGEADRLLKRALELQQTDRRSVLGEVEVPAIYTPPEKPVKHVRNWEAATFEGLAVGLPPSKPVRRTRAMPRKKAVEDQAESSVPVVEIKDLRKASQEQRREIQRIARELLEEDEWMSPTPLMGKMRRRGYGLTRNAALHLIRQFRRERETGGNEEAADEPMVVDGPKVEPAAVSTGPSVTSTTVVSVAPSEATELTISIEQCGRRAYASIRVGAGRDLGSVIGRIPALVPSLQQLVTTGA